PARCPRRGDHAPRTRVPPARPLVGRRAPLLRLPRDHDGRDDRARRGAAEGARPRRSGRHRPHARGSDPHRRSHEHASSTRDHVIKARRRFFAAALVFAAPVLVSACASQHPRPRYQFPPPVVPTVGTVVTGVASWYGPGYDGNRTSSGEVYDQDALTAAHFDWAFGTLVRVTFLDNGRSVVVRINDRFPNHKGRVIDLSKG